MSNSGRGPPSQRKQASGATVRPITPRPSGAAEGPYPLAVSAGSLDLFSAEEPIKIYRATGRYEEAGLVKDAAGAMLPVGSVSTLHNPGGEPAAVTIIAILPASANVAGSA
jgi:hypothetical protein